MDFLGETAAEAKGPLWMRAFLRSASLCSHPDPQADFPQAGEPSDLGEALDAGDRSHFFISSMAPQGLNFREERRAPCPSQNEEPSWYHSSAGHAGIGRHLLSC